MSTLRMPPTSKANRITGDLLLSPLRLLVSVSSSREKSWVRDHCSITIQNFSDWLVKCRAKEIHQRRGNRQWPRRRAVSIQNNSFRPKCGHWGTLKYYLYIYIIILANKLPSKACSSISEFFCFAGMMVIFSLATWRPVLNEMCGEGKGIEEHDISITVPGLMHYW